jgi:Ca2+-binding RTX toxin-like protein
MAWKLMAKRYKIDIFGATGHLFFDVLDDNNNRAYQIHGKPKDENGVFIEFGSPFDSSDSIQVDIRGIDGKYKGNYESVQLYSGTQAKINEAMKDVFAAQNFINAQKFDYSLTPGDNNDVNGFGGFSYNSNSVFNTILNVFKKSLSISNANANAALELGGSAFNPGSKLDILKDLNWSRNGELGSLVTGTDLSDTFFFPEQGNHIANGRGGDDVMTGGSGNDKLNGDAGNDALKGNAGNDALKGNAGNDTIYGGADNDAITGNDNDDLIFGENGNDNISGGAGRDRISGGAGNDIIYGGEEADQISGGPDIDEFIYLTTNESTKLNPDTISGFQKGIDKLNLTALGFTGLDNDGGQTEAGELRFAGSLLISDQIDFAISMGGIIPNINDILF